MYGENGHLLRAELSSLLRQHRIQLRIGGPGTHTVPVTTTGEDRAQIGEQVRRYRQSALVWCLQATIAVAPGAESRLAPRATNPFRLPAAKHGGLAALRTALDHTVRTSSAPLPGMAELTTQHELPLVEQWRQVARAAALGEQDFDAGLGYGRLDNHQLHTLIGDVATTVRALVVLDARYNTIPGWERLHRADRLGWAALACALDASLDPPDYSIDMRGWRPKTKVITGPAKPGLLGVLQAEHNLTIRMQAFPDAMNLRLVVDSQRLLSGGLATRVQKVEPALHEAWLTRERTYVDLQRELRNVGGKLGTGRLAVVEASNAWSRVKALPPDAHLDPRILHAFTTLFTRLDARIADVIEEGLERRAYLIRARPRARAQRRPGRRSGPGSLRPAARGAGRRHRRARPRPAPTCARTTGSSTRCVPRPGRALRRSCRSARTAGRRQRRRRHLTACLIELTMAAPRTGRTAAGSARTRGRPLGRGAGRAGRRGPRRHVTVRRGAGGRRC